MSDLINRQQAIDVLEEQLDYLFMLNKKDNPTAESKWDGINWARNTIAELPSVESKVGEWISVKERLPKVGKPVLISAKNNYYEYVCIGKWVEKYSVEDYGEEFDSADYNEENDKYYCPEGWYEYIQNWDDYSDVFIYDEVIAWQPLPEPYKIERSE